jgi:hypothetical protein
MMSRVACLSCFEAEIDASQSDLAVYKTWLCEEACVKAIVANIDVHLSLSLKDLTTSHLMWDHLRHSSQIQCTLLLRRLSCFASLTSSQRLHRQISVVWHYLENLGA